MHRTASLHSSPGASLAFALVAAWLLVPPAARGATLIVPDDFLVIQNALNAASAGDTVLVRAGTYGGNNIVPEGVTLVSEEGPEVTTLQGEGGGAAVNLIAGSDSTRVIGFTMRGYADGVLASEGGDPVIRGNVILDNTIAGVDVTLASRALVEDNLIAGSAVGVLCDADAEPILRRNTVTANQIGMRFLIGTTILADENIVVGNEVTGFLGNGSAVTFTCNDAWDNGTNYGGDLVDPTGTDGNISEDPIFCDPLGGFFTLRVGSPCAGMGGSCGRMGAFDIGCEGRIVRVDFGGAGEVITIQEGIDIAVSPDTVRVAPGIYAETPSLDHGIVVEGASAESTIIDAGGAPTGFTIAGVDSAALVRALTVRNATGDGFAFTGAGDGRLDRVASLANGTGIRLTGGAPRLQRVTIAGSIADGLVSEAGAAVTLESVLIAANAGAGVRAAGGTAVLSCSDVEGNAGGDFIGLPDPTGMNGNVSVDPLFCDAGAGRFTLRAGSPCLVDTTSCGTRGALGLGCDGRVWDVFDDGSGDAPGIQAAIDSSLAGDSVRVWGGKYAEAIELTAGVRLEAPEGAGFTHLVKPGASCGVRIVGGDSTTVVRGLSIAWFQQAGVMIESGAGARLEGCRVYSNGSGVVVASGWGAIDSTLLWANDTGVDAGGDSVSISRSTFHEQEGRGMVTSAGSALRLERSIVTSSLQAGVEVGPGSTATLSCNDVWSNAGGDYVGTSPGAGDFSADPLYCLATGGDFDIHLDSPCAPAHSGGCGLVGMGRVSCGVATSVGPNGTEGGVWSGVAGGVQLAVEPRPLSWAGVVRLRAPENVRSVRLRILDVRGRERWRETRPVRAGEVTEIPWPVAGGPELGSGIWFLHAEAAGASAVARIVLLR